MWKPEHRRKAARHGLRDPSDLRDAEWALAAPMIPRPSAAAVGAKSAYEKY